MKCRLGCGACCIAPSISSPIPGMPEGKKAGERCIQLDRANKCKLFDNPERPKVCKALKPQMDMCGTSREEALNYLSQMEKETAPH